MLQNAEGDLPIAFAMHTRTRTRIYAKMCHEDFLAINIHLLLPSTLSLLNIFHLIFKNANKMYIFWVSACVSGWYIILYSTNGTNISNTRPSLLVMPFL